MSPPPKTHYLLDVRALTVPGPDSDLSLWVMFPHSRYLFGCGEGTQRAFVQRHVAMKGLTGIFLPDGGSGGRAGLAGTLMTASDAGISKVDIIGPADTTSYLATVRGSVVRNNITVHTHPHLPSTSTEETSESEDDLVAIYKTDQLEVQSISFRPSRRFENSHEANASNGSGSGRSMSPSRRAFAQTLAEKHIRSMFQEATPSNRPALFECQPVPSKDDTATQMVYICKAPEIIGTFDNKKASELGIPFSKIRQQLAQGHAIEFDDPANPGTKKVVRPEEVITPSKPGPVFIMINTSLETMPQLLSSMALARYRHEEGQEPENEVALIVHRASKAVWQDPQYHRFIQSFGPKTQHLIATTDEFSHDPTFNNSAWNVLRLSILDGDMFAPLHIRSSPSSIPSLPVNTSLMKANHYVKLQPRGLVETFPSGDRDVPYPTTPDELERSIKEISTTLPEYAEKCTAAKESVERERSSRTARSIPGDDITVTTLGTGSAIPSLDRNVSCTHLAIPQVGGILLDCGEGSLGQMRRKFGMEGMKKVYEDLRMIFISHMHADHHLGLQHILEDRFKYGVTSKLYVAAPIGIALSLSEAGPWSASASQEALGNVVFVHNDGLTPGKPQDVDMGSPDDLESGSNGQNGRDVPESPEFRDGRRRWPRLDILRRAYKDQYASEQIEALIADLGLHSICAPIVQHRGRAWGLVIHHKDGWKIVYSGDTEPSQSLVKAGMDATLLIHEATLEDDKPEVAKEKGHSTFSQAIQIGVEMNAKRILLNHFSQRYPKIPKSTQAEDTERDISISYDFMTVKVGDMWKMKHYMDAATTLFSSTEEADDVNVEGAVESDRNHVEEKIKKPKKVKQPKEPKTKAEKGQQKGGGQGQSGMKRPGSPLENGGTKSKVEEGNVPA